jgi:hypothetical protein
MWKRIVIIRGEKHENKNTFLYYFGFILLLQVADHAFSSKQSKEELIEIIKKWVSNR